MIDWWDMNDIKPHKNLTLGRKDGVGKRLIDYEKKNIARFMSNFIY